MSLFILDAAGDKGLLKEEVNTAKYTSRRLLDENPHNRATDFVEKVSDEEEVSDCDGDYYGLPPPNVDLSKLIHETLQHTEVPRTKINDELEHAIDRVKTAAAFEKAKQKLKRNRIYNIDYSDFNPLTGKFDEEVTLLKTDVEKELGTSEVVGGLEKLKELPNLTKKKQRQLARLEREKTKGSGWFNLPATEITEEIENDLKVLQMRSVLDPKHFYKKNDLKVLPKYFQIGTVLHSPLDYYNERDTRRNKKKSLVEELLADAEIQKYTKRKYKEIIAQKEKYCHRKALKKMKKLKQ